MERRYATYTSRSPARSRWRRFRKRARLFHSVRLNLIGWMTVAGLCLAGAGLGYAVIRLLVRPTGTGGVGAGDTGIADGAGMVGGALIVLAVLVVEDRRRAAATRAPRPTTGRRRPRR